MTHRTLHRPLTAVALMALLLALIVDLRPAHAQPAPDSSDTAGSEQVRLDTLQTDLVRRVTPAVVGLTCSTERLRYYGTGVVVDPRGWVLTNVSVIPPQGKDIKVYFVDGSIHDATVVEYDVATESILLDISGEAADFPHIEIADAGQAEVGHRVYTFGNPFSIIETEAQVAIAAGAISGLGDLTDNAEEHNQSSYTGPVIETDAAINPGSDGGPLVDAAGRLLGVISLGIQRERMLGLCIPSHLIAKKLKSLRDRKLTPPPSQQISARGLVLGRHGRRLSPAVVWLEIDRVPEQQFEIPSDEDYAKLAQQRGLNPTQLRMLQIQHKLRKLMERPPGYGTGLAIGGGRYVLTSAFNIGHNREGRPAALGQLVRKITVHAEGLEAPLQAKLISRFRQYDLALLEVVGGKLPHAAEISAEDGLMEGHSVAVLGRHRGMSRVTLTEGIVSATPRNHNLVKVMQTDALINYANTGGPVIDLKGRVVGIATFLEPSAGFGLNSGVGLFTPAKVLREILPLMQQGKSQRNPTLPFLGVRGWEERSVGGAYVSAVYGGSAAMAAGVRPGDLIISLDSKPIGEWSDLIRMITSKAVGQTIEFEVVRKTAGGKDEKVKLRAKLGKRSWQ